MKQRLQCLIQTVVLSMRSDRGYTLKARYDHQLERDEQDPAARADVFLAKHIGERLNHWYPGHAWFVEVSHVSGIAKISIPLVMGPDRAFVLHIKAIHSDPSMSLVMKAGGEILERYKMPRAGFDTADFMAAIKKYAPLGRPRTSDSVPQ